METHNQDTICQFWTENDIFKKSIINNNDKPTYNYFDGPPFMTGKMHYGHITAGFIKDTITRYHHGLGLNVPRKNGVDCHGLPIEFEIEKDLGIKTTDEVLKFGIGNYNEACRGIVERCAVDWEESADKLARWIDFKNGYKTMDLSFMNSTWWVFKQLYNKGRVYEGQRIMPYSTTCGTPLSNFETQQNYQEVQDDSLFIKLPLVNKFKDINTSILVWTTTPWTLPANYALCVNPEINYSLVKSKENHYILATGLIEKIFKEPIDIISSFEGSELVGLEYIPPFTYNTQMTDKPYKIIGDNYVTETDGTGIVHISPPFGEDDYRVCLTNGIITKESKLFLHLDINGFVSGDIPELQGMFYKNYKDKTKEDLNTKVVKMLKEKGFYFEKKQIIHNYPFCWRSDTPLIYRAVSSWFVKVEDLRERMVELNKEINWFPKHVGEARFSNWLANARDWGISRSRFWGTPIPIWKSDDGDIICIGSSYELEELAGLECGSIKDLHRHFIDDIIINKDGKVYKRINEIFDCIAGNSIVSLGDGRSIAIKNMEKFLPNVMTYNENNGSNRNIGQSKSTYFMNKGIRDCIEIKLEDGRTLECTPEHKILVLENDKYTWINATDVVLDKTRIVASVKYPELNTNISDDEKEWKLQCDEILLKYNTLTEKIKSLTFSRLLGYICADGSFQNHTTTGQISGTFFVANIKDAEQIVKDIDLLCGTKPNINYNKRSNIHIIYTPKKLLKAFLSIDGIEVGRRINKKATLPSFLISKTNKCPNDIIKEFLSGMFGGDGIAPRVACQLSRQKIKKTYIFTGVGFIASKTDEHLNSLVEQYKIIVEWLNLFNIKNTIILKPYETSSSKKNAESVKKYALELAIRDNDDIINFHEKIGFAYCSHKQVKLEICVAWRKMRKNIIDNYDKMLKTVLKIKKDNSYDIKKSYETMISQLDETEIVYDKINLEQVRKCIRNKINVENCLPNILLNEWLKTIGAYDLFFDENMSKGKNIYAVKNDDNFLPSYNLKVIGKKNIGKKDVYDISVEDTHSFLANGMVVHNCWFESGAMPYSALSQVGIVELLRNSDTGIEFEVSRPFIKTKDGLIHWILPADFIAEGLDQTRGWFYTLLVLSTSLFDMIPFKNVIVNGLVLAEDGKKMSKRLKNYPDPMEVVKEYGSDCLRLYLLNSPVVRAEPLKFSKSGVHNMMKDVIIPYKNTIIFLKEYLNLYLTENKKSPIFEVLETNLTNPINVWIIQQYGKLRQNYYQSMDYYDLKNAVLTLCKLVDVINNGFIKLGRNLLKGKEGNILWSETLSTLYYIVKFLIYDFKALMPYFCEIQYLELKNFLNKNYIFDEYFETESIHLKVGLGEYMNITTEKINLATDFDIVYNIINTIYQLRGISNMSAKKPLRSVSIVMDEGFDLTYSPRYREYMSFVSDECNVLEIKLLNYSVLNVKKTIVPNKGPIFKKFGKVVSETYNKIIAMTSEELDSLLKTGNFDGFEFDSSLFNISYEINVSGAEKDADYIFKDFTYGQTTITILADKYYDELIDKLYFYRLVATRVQRSRKFAGLHPWDEIKTYYSGEPKYDLENEKAQEIIKAITKYTLEKFQGENTFYQNHFEEINMTIYLEKI